MGKGKKGVRKGRDSAPAAASKKEERAAKRQLKKQKGQRFGDKEERDFEAQVQTLGGTIHHQASDGNCLFRSINDQLEGKPEKHMECRRKIVEYMEARPDDYSPFVEDDESWENYTPRMMREREWGGQLEIVAASRLFEVNIVVHQLNAPRLEVHADNAKRTIHLSYHGESHYNSVRAVIDPCRPGEPAQQWAGVASVAAPPAPAPAPAAANGKGDGKKEKCSGKKKKKGAQQHDGEGNGIGDGDQKGDGKEAAVAVPAADGVQEDGDGAEEGRPAAELATESQPDQGGGGDAEAEDDGERAGGGDDADAAADKNEAAKDSGGQCPCGSGKKYRKCCRKADRQRQRLGGGGGAAERNGGGGSDGDEEDKGKGAASSKQHKNKKKQKQPPAPPSSDPAVDAVASKLEAIAM